MSAAHTPKWNSALWSGELSHARNPGMIAAAAAARNDIAFAVQVLNEGKPAARQIIVNALIAADDFLDTLAGADILPQSRRHVARLVRAALTAAGVTP